MKFVIDAVMWIVNWLFSKKARILASLPLKISITTIFVLVGSLYLSSILAFVYFLITLFNALFDLINQANNAGSSVGSGEAYGITLSSLWNVFIGFLNASGLAPAMLTATSLLVTLLSTYFAFALTKMITERLMLFLNSLTDIVRMYEG